MFVVRCFEIRRAVFNKMGEKLFALKYANVFLLVLQYLLTIQNFFIFMLHDGLIF